MKSRFVWVLLLTACAGASVTAPAGVVPVDGPPPLVIPCERALVVQARSTRAGVAAEYDWINKHYPKHTEPVQGLSGTNGRMYDTLRFQTADGQAASVCFDITSFFGRF